MPEFRKASIDQTTTVQVGYMCKPMAVTAVTLHDEMYVHFTTTLDWVCRALSGKGRSRTPLKAHTPLMDGLLSAPWGGRLLGKPESESSLEQEVDPMQDLYDCPGDGGASDCAGGRSHEAEEVLETPKKRSRAHLSAAEKEFVARVRLADIVSDIHAFNEQDRKRMQEGTVRVLLKTNRRRSAFVHEKDLDLLMLAMRVEVERMGVPSVDLPDEESALADSEQWFDARTSCWHVRQGAKVVTSKPVRRTGSNGRPLDVETFKRHKMEVLEALQRQPFPEGRPT